MPFDIGKWVSANSTTIVLLIILQLITFLGTVIGGIIILRRNAKQSQQRREESDNANLIKLREIAAEERTRAQLHEQHLEESRQKADAERTAALERMAQTRDSMMLQLMDINRQFTSSVDAFRVSMDSSSKITSDSTVALREHTRILGGMQENILTNLKSASDERMGAVKQLLEFDTTHSERLEQQISLSKALPEAVYQKLDPVISSLNSGIQSTIESLRVMQEKVEALHIVADRHINATNGIALLAEQIGTAVKQIDASTTRIDSTTTMLIGTLKEISAYVKEAPQARAVIPVDSESHPSDGRESDL